MKLDTHKEHLLEGSNGTGSRLSLTPIHNPKTNGHLEMLTSTTIHNKGSAKRTLMGRIAHPENILGSAYLKAKNGK